MQKTLIYLGLGLLLIGLTWPWIGAVGSKLNIGRLPGDILIEKDGFRLYMPFGSALLISLVLSLVLWLTRK